jgi:hypothetical protein
MLRTFAPEYLEAMKRLAENHLRGWMVVVGIVAFWFGLGVWGLWEKSKPWPTPRQAMAKEERGEKLTMREQVVLIEATLEHDAALEGANKVTYVVNREIRGLPPLSKLTSQTWRKQ